MKHTRYTSRGGRAQRLAVAWSAGLALSAGGALAAEPSLKACADPDNLPFSSAAGNTKGFYLELADHLAGLLQRASEPVWQLTYFGKRAVRSSLLARNCDLFIGLPADGGFMGKQVLMSKPFAVFSYALVLPQASSVQVLADLRGRRVAVQLSTPPQSAVAEIDGIEAVTVLSPEEGMRALAEGRADAAYLWGPSAGYLNQSGHGGRYRVMATEGQGMAWPVAIGFRRDDAALRDSVQRELDTLGPWLATLAAKYGFPGAAPQAAPQRSSTASAHRVPAQWVKTVATTEPAAPGGDAAVAAGRQLFNTNCSHCHGPNAASPDPRIDLRKLLKRYGEDMNETFDTTVHNGRPDKGMPAWKGVLSSSEITAIKTFVDSVQPR